MGLNQPQLAASVGKPNAFGKAEDFFICESLDCQFLSTPLLPPAHYACRVEDHCFRLAGNQGRRCKKPARISGDVNLYD
ncbi:hypothetical protein CABS01_01519 [Colletotrichum abscissum]|uniref:uncharacterized protein n=1 Tax=Colletotrichum abscissum TaxID=1671311 RepID=UPI0027D6A852|nr:uncharacterized protein CABS01_01519 [Colletotrichum abscissum]KAK1495712.1 hypothetical protein CABS01_01519 [Colletotrichum abscissum]KAK1717117.1 hypothetical protein BDP67DRAFT_508512 [Colletotrichum lupini]